jgi:hypothetical protein
MSKDLKIIQFNCGNSNGKATRAFFDSVEHAPILAIQEPGYSPYTKSTYCPRPYELAYEALPATKVCFMVRRDIGDAQWRRTQYGPNVAVLELTLPGRNLSIVNVYNPRGSGPRITEWQNLNTALEEIRGELILLGDFNAHHPQWGGVGTACEQHADHLLVETRRRDLTLLTPPGEPTWVRGNSSTVIDLTFISNSLANRVRYCGARPDWLLIEDHIPIDITLEIDPPQRPNIRPKYALDKLDQQRLRDHLNLRTWVDDPEPLNSLQEALGDLLPQCCPQARPHARARPD